MADFSKALSSLRKFEGNSRWRREEWRAWRYIVLRWANPTSMSYLEFIDAEKGHRAPWSPTRCDLLGDDWIEVRGEHAPRREDRR